MVNLVDEAIAEAMVRCAASLPPGESELEHAGLTATPSVAIAPPRIAEAPVHLECREWSALEIGRNRLVIGTVHRLHVRDGILDPATLQIRRDAYHPIGRMHGADGYTKTRDFFALARLD